MTTYTNLTELENNFVNAIFQISNFNCGADSYKKLSLDNCSDFEEKDIKKKFKDMNMQQIGGVLSSLSKKSIINWNPDFKIWCFDNEYVNYMANQEK